MAATLLSTMRACRLDSKNAVLKDRAERSERIARAVDKEYADYRTWAEGLIENNRLQIEVLTEEVLEHESTIETVLLENQRLKMLEPAYPELESHPLVINLRAQISTLESAIAEYIEQVKAQDNIILQWTSSFKAEHKLRLRCEDALEAYKRSMEDWKATALNLEWSLKKAKAWGVVTKATTVAGVVIILLILR